MTNRTFEHTQAKRAKVPLLVGLFGTSGSGKTYSALRLATGMKNVSGGSIFVIDTEARRSLHYAPKEEDGATESKVGTFEFEHLPFGAPFSPLDYLAAIDHCVKNGAKTIIIDSMSHEHEGPGGVLEMHDAEARRIAGDNAPQWKMDAANFPAWQKPKADRQRLINTMLQYDCNFILCFRAKEKIKLISKTEREAAKERGEKLDPMKQMGFMPIGDPAFVYEMMISCLLYPGAKGVPTWDSSEPGEKMMVKIPGQFSALFAKPRPLDEQIGEAMARWANGDEVVPKKQPGSIEQARSILEGANSETVDFLLEGLRDRSWTKEEGAEIKKLSDAARKRKPEPAAADTGPTP